MVTNVLAGLLFFIGFIYFIVGLFLASKLAHSIGYVNGVIYLFNKVQNEVFFKNKTELLLKTQDDTLIYEKLKKLVSFFYVIFIPLSVLTFLSHILE